MLSIEEISVLIGLAALASRLPGKTWLASWLAFLAAWRESGFSMAILDPRAFAEALCRTILLEPFVGHETGDRLWDGAPVIAPLMLGALLAGLVALLWRFRHRLETRAYAMLLATSAAAALGGGGGVSAYWGAFPWLLYFARGLRPTAVVPYYAAISVAGIYFIALRFVSAPPPVS